MIIKVLVNSFFYLQHFVYTMILAITFYAKFLKIDLIFFYLDKNTWLGEYWEI